MKNSTRACILFFLFCTTRVTADTDWISVTLDNDLFVGNDNGYTNGLYVSWYHLYDTLEESKPTFWVKPVLWTMPKDNFQRVVNSYTIGQMMMTPDDITIENPSEDDLPYAGMLFFNANYSAIGERVADRVSTRIGIVGPLSGAEEAQKGIHELIGADEPKGWDTQLDDEVVFQFSRGRIWRQWASAGDRSDFLLSTEGALGTISSSVYGSMMIRYGRNLTRTYGIPLLNNSRVTNPLALEGNWYVYFGISLGYEFNNIFIDGNTFRDSRSIDYDHERLGVAAGFAYSWSKVSVTLALNDYNLIEDSSEEQLENLTRYGSLTLALKI